MTTQHKVLGEISPSVSTEIPAMKELDFDRDKEKATFHLRTFRNTQGKEDLAKELKKYYEYSSGLAARVVARLSSSLTVQAANIRLVQVYDPEKHRAFYEVEVIDLVGAQAHLSDLDALENMVHFINTQDQSTSTPSIEEPRWVLLLAEGRTLKGRKSVGKQKQKRRHVQVQDVMGNIEMMAVEEDWFDAPESGADA